MENINVKAYAKINLGLKILDKRKDGYHNLETIICPINLYDEIHIEKIDSGVEIFCNVKELENEKNLCYKVAKVLNVDGIKINIIKHIPTEAGLGGGSTDCATTLIALNKLFDLNIEKEKLLEIGKNLGADVPACMISKPVLAHGIGEVLTDINIRDELNILIIKPDKSFSTGKMFANLDSIDKNKIHNRLITKDTIYALDSGDLELLSKSMYNDFEYVEDINEFKEALIETGAVIAQMTGSGSCVYGLYKNKTEQEKAYRKLKEKYEVFLCFNQKQ